MEKKAHKTWLLLLLLLMLWYWYKHRTPDAVAPTPFTGPPPDFRNPTPDPAPTPIVDTTVTPPPGGYQNGQTMAGFAFGDYSQFSLDHLAPETIAYLDSFDFYNENGDTGVPLHQAWLNYESNGADVTMVGNQIAEKLRNYVHT